MANDNFIPTYFLLGKETCKLLAEFFEFEEFLQELIDDDIAFALYKFDGDPIDLMYNAHGWDDYAVLTKEEYDKLTEL